MRVAYQGETGAYSEEACLQHFGKDITPVPCRTFTAIFEAVARGDATVGILPAENSTAGSINRAYDLLLEHELPIVGETILRIQHALLALPGTDPADVRIVRSHPQALAQCAAYLERHGWLPEPAYDTAGSARDLAAHPEPGIAVIAGRLAGRRYGLRVLDYPIEDVPYNYTRFLILGCTAAPRADRNKTSLVFVTDHVPGAIYACLGEFAARDINLTKFESRPRRDKPWHYVFYLDFEGHGDDPRCAAALEGLAQYTSFLRVLGSYPAAPPTA